MIEPRIEKNIPIPPKAPGRGSGSPKYRMPYEKMEVGDSVFVATRNPQREAKNFVTAARNRGFKATVRFVAGGVRVWKIA